MLQTLLGSLWVQPAPAVPTSDGGAAKGPRPNASVYAANLRHIQSHVLPTGWRLNAVQVRGSDQGTPPSSDHESCQLCRAHATSRTSYTSVRNFSLGPPVAAQAALTAQPTPPTTHLHCGPGALRRSGTPWATDWRSSRLPQWTRARPFRSCTTGRPGLQPPPAPRCGAGRVPLHQPCATCNVPALLLPHCPKLL